ncbi:CG13561 [Drosophila busckii]|uniref:CG13561 n=2 Tax=Drosophila busckii TaxID=30019 RepID=A0A0M5JAI9_DROBS|nr:CG13561 [Drosophila busckii]
MRIQLLKRASGYKPFLYDVSHHDFCEYLEKRNHPFVNIIFNSLANYTNVNKCPLPSQLSIEHFRFPVKSLDLLPLPFGEYAIYATFSAEQRERLQLKVFFTLTEFRK